MRRRLACVLALGAAGLAAACGEGPGAAAPEGSIAALHLAKCGACHRRVDPGMRSRPVFEAALARHRARVVLTDAEWASLLEYLSPGGTPAGPVAARH